MILTTCINCHTMIHLDPNLLNWVGEDKSTRCPKVESEFSHHNPPSRYLLLANVWEAMNVLEKETVYSPTPDEYKEAVAHSLQSELDERRGRNGRHHPAA